MKFFIMKISPASSYFLLFRSKQTISSRCSFLNVGDRVSYP